MLGLTPKTKVHNVYSLGARVKLIGNLAKQDMLDRYRGPQLRALAGQIVRACPVRGDVGQLSADICELQTIFDWVVDHVRYTGDIGSMSGDAPMDLYQSPYQSIRMGVGDCDDHVGVNTVILRYLGWETKVRVSSSDGNEWSHIYCMVKVPKVPVAGLQQSWECFDTTLGHGKLGQQARLVKFTEYVI